MFGFQPTARRHAQQPEKPQRFAAGGMVRGPGTGTSDSIEAEVEPGTFIMPADSTEAIGPEALQGMGKVPVRLSDGEFEVPPEQAMALGIAVLKAMKDATHAPVNGQDGGQTDDEVAEARGFAPAAARGMQKAPELLFADGGMVDQPGRSNSFGDAAAASADPSVTRVNTGGSDTYGRSAPVAPAAVGFQPAAARMNAMTDPRSTSFNPNPYAAANAQKMADFSNSIGSRNVMEQGMPQAPAPVTAGNSFGDGAAATRDASVTQVATGFQPGRGATQAQSAAPAGWADRNAQRNVEVAASSIVDSPERSQARSALAPTPAASLAATGFQPASQRTAPMPRTPGVGGFQPRRYADGGLVQDDVLTASSDAAPAATAPRAMSVDELEQAGLLAPRRQVTIDLSSTAPPPIPRQAFADGGLVTDEERRQGLVSQIPTGGMTAPAADGSQNNPLNNEVGRNALNTLTAIPGATGLASRGAATTARGIGSATAAAERAAPAAWEVVEGGTSAARAAAPTGGALTRAASVAPDISATGFSSRTAQMLGSPGGQIAERGATEAGQALPAAGRSARGFTPYADVVEPLALSAPSASQAAGAAAQGARGFGPMAAAGGAAGLGAASLVSGDSSASSPPAPAPGTPSVTPPISGPQRAPAAETPMGPPMSASNSITRDGNSYSGPANLSGDVSIRNPDGSLRAPASVSTLPGGGISEQNMSAADALAGRENTASLARLGLLGAGAAPGFSGVIGQQGNGNMWTRTPDQQRQDAMTQLSSIDPRTAARGAGALNAMDAQALQGVKNQADVGVAQLQNQGLMNRTLITERGNNTRAAIAAQGQTAAAALKAQQGNKPPAGYRWTPTGSLEAIPGGPAEAKVEDQQKQKEAGFDATRQTIGTINRLLANNNGLTGATGMVGIQRFFPGTDAADFASQVETLKAQTFLPMVQQLRGMGALSNAEGDKLNAAVGALNFNMSEKAFGESLGRIRDQLSGALQKAGIDTKGASTWGLQPPSTVAEQAQGGQPAAAPAAQRSVTRTGMVNGRRVAQYSDGSIEYAD